MWVKHGKTIVNHPHIYIYIYISEIISVKLRIIKLGENDQKQHGRTCRSTVCGTSLFRYVHDATAHQCRDRFKAMHFFIYIYI